MTVKPIEPMSKEKLFELFIWVIQEKTMEPNKLRSYTLNFPFTTQQTNLNSKIRITKHSADYTYEIDAGFKVKYELIDRHNG